MFKILEGLRYVFFGISQPLAGNKSLSLLNIYKTNHIKFINIQYLLKFMIPKYKLDGVNVMTLNKRGRKQKLKVLTISEFLSRFLLVSLAPFIPHIPGFA